MNVLIVNPEADAARTASQTRCEEDRAESENFHEASNHAGHLSRELTCFKDNLRGAQTDEMKRFYRKKIAILEPKFQAAEARFVALNKARRKK